MATKVIKPAAPAGWGDEKTQAPGAPVDAPVFSNEDRIAALESQVSRLQKIAAHLCKRAGLEPDDPRLG